MRIYALLLLVALGFAIPCHAGKKLRVLFLGNSYTYYNNMPQIVAGMAASTGDTLVWDMYAPGGYTIDNHGLDTASENRIKKGGWDYLVLQEQSQLPSFQSYFSNGLYGLCYTFREYNPCGRIMFYMTWGRKNGDASNCAAWPPVCTYIGMDSLLRLRYTQMAVNNKSALSPVGAVWRHIRTNSPSINLYEPDESHPTAAGSYLAASSFYTAIFKKDPTAVSYNFVLSAANANTIKQAAKTVVFDSLAFWNYEATIPVADFSYTIGTGINQVNFLNESLLADTYLWDFGDGTTSAVKHPVHNYASNGTYTITLHAYNCDIDTTYEHTYQSTVTFCPFTLTITPQTQTLCPGTSDTLWTQAYDAYQWYDEYHNAIAGATGQYLVVSTHQQFYVKATLNGCSEISAPAQVFIAGSFSFWHIVPGGKLVGEDSACSGDTIALRVMFNKPPVAHDSLMDWSFNGQPVTGYHNDTLWITQSGMYEAKVRHELCPVLDVAKQFNFTFINCPLGIDNVAAMSFTIAPNPVPGVLKISSAAFLSGSCEIQLTDQLGRAVYAQPCSAAAQQTLDLSGYGSGIYFISITGNGGVMYRGKVLKQ